MTTQEIELLTIDELTEARKAAKLLWDGGILQPAEKKHMWQVIMRIEAAIKAKESKIVKSVLPGH